MTNSTSFKLLFPFNRLNEQLLLLLLHLLKVAKVEVKAKEARVKGVKAKAAAKEERIIKTIYPIYQN